MAPRRASKRARSWIAGALVGAIVLTGAVIAQGFDTREVAREEAGIWVTRDAGQYARVNTDTGEIDTVRQVEDPSGVLQSGSQSVLLSAGLSRAWPVDAANPLDLRGAGDPGTGEPVAPGSEPQGQEAAGSDAPDAADSGPVSQALPEGTREILSTGSFFALRTEDGMAFGGTLSSPDADMERSETVPAPRGEELAARIAGAGPLLPEGQESDGERSDPTITALALTDTGRALLYGAETGTIHRYDLTEERAIGGAVVLPRAARNLARPQLAEVGGDWVLFDAESGELWTAGREESVPVEIEGEAHLQLSGGGTSGILVADGGGLWGIPLTGGDPERLLRAQGIPAQPTEIAGVAYTAWLGADAGTLWDSATGGPTPLRYDEDQDPGERALRPVIRSNGDRGVLSEQSTGMLWGLPDGRGIPLAQWTLQDPPQEESGAVIVDDVSEQLPPVATDDSFGVRAGAQAELPVLLNDVDPNRQDVLSIVPGSLAEGLSPADFGTVQLLPGEQSLSVAVGETTGTATFTYRVTDGTHQSEPATVTLTVQPEERNTAPEWCGVSGCQRAWPAPEVVPGGTLVLPMLEGWVDPEGDQMVLLGARPQGDSSSVRVVANGDGTLAIRHTDPHAAESALVIELEVGDGSGRTTSRDLTVRVSPDAGMQVRQAVHSVPVAGTLTVQPLEQVSGGSGSYQLLDAVLPQGAAPGLTLTPQPASGQVHIRGEQPGTWVAQVTVRDTITEREQSGAFRISVTEGPHALTLPPMRAFVRPLQDTVVNVLDAVPGAAERVLVVEHARVVPGVAPAVGGTTGATPDAASSSAGEPEPGATLAQETPPAGDLAARVLDHEYLRITGSTADGAPGRVGALSVRVSDAAGASATGQITVFQLSEASDQDVVTVDDRATVRAGSVVDIRVLENDVSASGERLALRPEITGAGADGALAFASGNTLRYLAPTVPGTYTLGYHAFLENVPTAGDDGRVLIEVLPREGNRDPVPVALTARVAPGQSTGVAVPLSGVDPDGDRVRLVSVSSASEGQVTAEVSRRGNELVVRAAAQAAPGTVRLRYAVRDGLGGEASADLWVAVTAPETTDSSPVAVTDAVRLVRGSAAPAVVEPLANDSDPAQGRLALVSVVPNVSEQEHPAEYRRLNALLDQDELSRGRIGVFAGEEAGVRSYRYTVRSSSSSSTAEGLLVVRVSERVGAQAPVVLDTVLTARERTELSSAGVDVVTDRVRWASGNTAGLRLSLWDGGDERFTVAGNRIVGEYRPEGEIVAFTLSGPDDTGAEAVSYGFLIIPPLDEIRLTLQPGLAPLAVDEDRSTVVPVTSLVDVARGDRIELRQASFSVQRSGATCAAEGQRVRYSAGHGAPWSDHCVIEARLVGQQQWTRLAVPVTVTPKDPTLELHAMTRVVSPGAEQTINLLRDMGTWPGGRAGDAQKLTFTVGTPSQAFRVQQSGNTVTVTARADAQPGAQEHLSVRVTGAGESTATLTLRVGDAPKSTPRGGTVAKTCSVGDPCRITVTGVPGEFDPFAGTAGGGLTVDSVSAHSCRLATLRPVSDRDLGVTWLQDSGNGGTCSVGFTVRDAQGRTGTGTLELDARGRPAAPASVTTVAYTGSSVTVRVALGQAQQAYPAVTGVHLDGADSARCSRESSSSFLCEVGGLEHGVPLALAARANNPVGTSPATSPHTTWAYQAPEMSAVSARTEYRPGVTTPERGLVILSLSASADTRAFRIEGTGQEVPRTGEQTETHITLPAGPQTIRVTPLSAFSPPIASGTNTGAQGSAQVTVAGGPRTHGALQVTPEGNTGLTASGASLDANGSGLPGTLIYRIGAAGAAPAACQADSAGALLGLPGDSASGAFSGLTPFRSYSVIACASNGYGVASAGPAEGFTGGTIPAPEVRSGYTVAGTPDLDAAGNASYGLVTAPEVRALDGLLLEYDTGAGWQRAFLLDQHRTIDGVSARQCLPDSPGQQARCSEAVRVPAAGAPNLVTVGNLPQCVPGDDLGATAGWQIVSLSARHAATVSPATVQPGDPSRATLTVTFGQEFQSLRPSTHEVAICAP